jgi:hypothetical protein
MIERLARAEAELMAQKEIVEQLRVSLVEQLGALGVSSTVTESGRRVTVVRSTSTSWDVEVLKDILAPRGLWEQARIVQEVVDDKAIERLVDRGDVRLEEIEPALSVKERKPYPKVSG